MTHPDYPAPALFIDGQWTQGTANKSEPIYNPATGEVIGHVPHASVEDLDRAIAAAERGFKVWSQKTVMERGTILCKAMDLIRERAQSIAKIMTMEEGKNFKEASMEIGRAAGGFLYNAEEAKRAYGRVIPFQPGFQLTTIQRPIGPVAAFVPWNFPAGGPIRKLSASLAAGCSIIIKVSEETPGTVCQIVRCLDEAGVPKGVVNLVFGDPAAISEHLIASDAIRLITFTGSVPVGKLIAGLAAKVMKPCLMELGGHAPVIICEDADPAETAKRLAFPKFMNSGQVCTSPTRFLVHEKIHDQFVDSFIEEAAKIKVGNGLDEGVRMGPMANPRRLEAMERLVADAVQCGAKLQFGGKRIGNQGWFFEPTILTDVPLNAEIMHEEPFGPIVPIRKFSSLDDVMIEANATPFGLAAYGFTKSAMTADWLAENLEAGILSINHGSGSVQEAPSGGVKESGYGREGGPEGFSAYMITKRISHRLD